MIWTTCAIWQLKNDTTWKIFLSVSWNKFSMTGVNSLRPKQNGRHFADDIFKSIFLNENVWISIKISLKFVLKGPINDIPALVQIMAWRRPGDKPLSEPMLVSLPMHICVTRAQWVKRVLLIASSDGDANEALFIKIFNSQFKVDVKIMLL